MLISNGVDRKSLSKILLCLIFLIFSIHFVATKLYWYYSVWYLDIVMHFLGGFWVGLVFFYLLSPRDGPARTFLKTILFVLVIGIGWEIFEMLVNDVIAKNPFDFFDTIADLAADLFGGAVATFYFLKKIVIESGNEVQSN